VRIPSATRRGAVGVWGLAYRVTETFVGLLLRSVSAESRQALQARAIEQTAPWLTSACLGGKVCPVLSQSGIPQPQV
jgi:hypothetical protein